jgi:hypothetical protein
MSEALRSDYAANESLLVTVRTDTRYSLHGNCLPTGRARKSSMIFAGMPSRSVSGPQGPAAGGRRAPDDLGPWCNQ